MGKYSHYATGDPEMQGIIDAIVAQRKIVLDRKAMKQGMDDMIDAKTKSLTFDDVVLGEVQIPMRGGTTITGFTYRPKGKEIEMLPLLLNFHEGGYILGKAAMDHAFCAAISAGAGLAVLNVDYRLAPEFPFPGPINDGYDALKWAVEHANELKTDIAKGLFVCGTSAGGNISAALTIRARDDPSFKAKLTGQVLLIPNVCSSKLYPIEKYRDEITSYDEYANDPIIPREILDFLGDVYDGPLSKEQLVSTDRSPLLAESLAGLPKAIVAVAGQDPLRDEGIVYANRLKETIGEDSVRLNVYPNAFHAFIGAVPDSAASKKVVKDVIDGLKWMMNA